MEAGRYGDAGGGEVVEHRGPCGRVDPEGDEDPGRKVLERPGLVKAGWRVVFTPQARRDAKKLARAGLRPQAETLLALLARDPFEARRRFENLVGEIAGAFSRRINIQHRLVYQVLEKERTVKVLRLFTHSEQTAAAGTGR